MKKTLFYFLVLWTSISFAQQNGSVILNWTDNKSTSFNQTNSFEPITIKIPQFDENFSINSSTKQIFYTKKIDQSSPVNENSLQITNIIYETISQAQLGDLPLSSIPSAINASLKSIRARNKISAVFFLSPIIKEGFSFKRVKSFDYSFVSGSALRKTATSDFTTLSNSVLANGDWFRFFVQKSGVYRISKTLLQQIGINPNAIDPRRLKIFGNGGRMIPIQNAIEYPADLTENAIQVSGQEDGVFNDGDFITFYAEGVDNWDETSKTTNNLYSDRSYYYITASGADGKRIQNMIQPSGSGTAVTAFDDYQYHEIDAINIGRLGRRWFGEEFSTNNEITLDFNFPNIVTSTPISVSGYFAATSQVVTSFQINANGQLVNNLSISSSGTAFSSSGEFPITQSPAAENIALKITYNNAGVPSSKGYLDYIRIKALRNLRGYGKQFRFQFDQSAQNVGIGEYQLSNAASIAQVWDITDIYNVTKAENSGQTNFSFKSNFGVLRKYIAVDFNDLYTPLLESNTRVTNQNLKGNIFLNAQGQFQDIDYIIVSLNSLAPQAERLANFHRTYSGLNVKVVSLESIYQEFSSGKQDIGAIRNFMKYVFFNASSEDKQVKYLNLFGDASFDFKNRVSIFSNYVPIYHALYGNDAGEASFCSDDFFGLLDLNEGDLDGTQPSTGLGLDVAVGRMIASSNGQANELVDKIIEYHDIQSYGSWRNNYVGIADDPSINSSADKELQYNQNKLTDVIAAQKPFINVKKILLDSYQQVTGAGGGRYPKARQDFFDAFEKGALVINYLGHGGEDGLAQERIFEKSDAQNLNNRFKYPLFVTITCDFSRFDNPFRQTAGELTFLNPRGGAIGMITTVREISQTTGQNFNDKLSQFLFSYGSNTYVSIAEALRLAKNDNRSTKMNVVCFIGDPALMLAITKPKIRLTKVNDMPVTGPIDDFKSLSYMKLAGEVTDEFDNPLSTYTGQLSVQVFDKELARQTLRNDNVDAMTDTSDFAQVMPFTTLGETIFRGNASVTNGQFEFGFVVPRDITINVAPGRASFYSKRNQILLDKSGFDTTIKIGGINENAPADDIGPTVKLFMNDQTFISGGITNESPIFLAFLDDENGINTASGIGHDIVAILDGDETNPYKLNDYYETELDNYKSGKLKFPFRNLALGLHTITFKAWDVYNNPVISEIQFIVVGDETITITNVLNYPNPFVNYTQFWFTHNKPFEPLEVQVQVLTITGKVVWTKNQTITTDGFLSREITWDGKDDFGDKIGKGVYIYKLTVKSVLTNSKTHKYEKLVIL